MKTEGFMSTKTFSILVVLAVIFLKGTILVNALILISIVYILSTIRRIYKWEILKNKKRQEEERLKIYIENTAKFIIRNSESIKKSIETKKAELDSRCYELVCLHQKTLIKKYRQKIIKDDYGNVIDDDWQNEKRYFINNVLLKDNAINNLISSIDELYINLNAQVIPDCMNTYQEEHDDELTKLIGKAKYTMFIWRPLDAKEAAINKTSNDIDFTTRYIEFDDNGPDNDVELMSPSDFESYCAKVLDDLGWNAKVTAQSGDQGVDVIAEKEGIEVALQCKLYSYPVGNSAVQEAYAGMKFYQAQYAAVVTNQDFTKSAKQLAESTGVMLMHYSDLFHLNDIIKTQVLIQNIITSK